MTTTKAVLLLAAFCSFCCFRAGAQTGTTPVLLDQNAGQVQISFLGDPGTYSVSNTVRYLTVLGPNGQVTAYEEITTFTNAGDAFHVVVTQLQYDSLGAVSFYQVNINGVSLSFDLQVVQGPHDVPNQLTDSTGTPYSPVAAAATSVGVSNFTANWFGSAGATSYRLDVSTNSSFVFFLPGYQDRDVGDVRSRTITGLAPGGIYCYRVRAVNDSGTSGNSATIFVSATETPSSTGTNGFVFGPPATPVWDISGFYNITNHMQTSRIKATDFVFNDLGIGVDSHGKIVGAGTMLVLIGDGILGGDYKVTGKMSGGGQKTRANFTVKFKGNGTAAGVVTKSTINVKYDLAIVPATLKMAGKTSGNANFSHIGNGKIKSDIVLPLPAGADGGWNVTLDLLPVGTKISGTSIIQVDNIPPNVVNTKVKGTVPKNGPAKLKLTGTGNSAGTKLDLEYAGLASIANVQPKINGKILGQKVKN